MKAAMIKNADIVRNYGDDGIFSIELLPGVYDGPMRTFKYFMKAGSSISPEGYANKAVVCVFRDGTGYIEGKDGGFSIKGLCFYAPDHEKSEYTIHATSDLEFIMCICDMDDYDFEREAECSVYLPFFRTFDQAYNYEQYCKSEGMHSKSVMFGDCGRLGKITIGIVYGYDAGTIEKGHPEVHQFNYAFGDDCDFTLTVDGVSNKLFRHVAGDYSFVNAQGGPDHSLVSSPGKQCSYVWIEVYTSKHGKY